MKLKKVIAALSAVTMLGSLAAAMPMSASALTVTKDFTHEAVVYSGNETTTNSSNDTVITRIIPIGTVSAGDKFDVTAVLNVSANDKAAIGVYLYTPVEGEEVTYDNVLANGTAIAAMGHLKTGAGNIDGYKLSAYFNGIGTKADTATTASDLSASADGNLYFLLQVGTGNRTVKTVSISVTKEYDGADLRTQALSAADNDVFTLYNDIAVNDSTANNRRITVGKSVTIKSSGEEAKTISGPGNDKGWLLLENGSGKTLTLENVIITNTNNDTAKQFAVVSENAALVINNSIINGQIHREKGTQDITLTKTKVNVTAVKDADFSAAEADTNSDAEVWTATVNGYGNTFSSYNWNITAENEGTATTEANTTITTDGAIQFAAVLYNLGEINVTNATVTVE